jgi:uncharacterized cysteine cluster protein YcgN (CxxCxxCC family)
MSTIMQPPRQNLPARHGDPLQRDETAPESALPYWRVKSLEAMSPAEWEALCDGCGRCCLVKLEDEDTGTIHATSVGCTLFDAQTCRCRDYDNRARIVPDCVTLTPEAVRTLTWLPPTCAYRLIAEGRDLYWWHPLVSGDDRTVETAGVSVKGRVSASEDDVPAEMLQEHLATWPLRFPKKAR